mgnify:CR=1 FL=1
MTTTRTVALLALLAIGDGVIGAVAPRRHMARWSAGPAPYEAAMRPFARHPQLTRALSVVEVALGLTVALRLPARR